MKTSSPPDQKIDRSHTTTTAGRKERNPPKPLPDLWIVHHRPQTADMQTQVRTEEGFPQTKGGRDNSCKPHLPWNRPCPCPAAPHLPRSVREGCRPLASEADLIRSRGVPSDLAWTYMMVVMVARGEGDSRHTPCFEMVVQCRRAGEGAGGKHLGRLPMGWTEGGEVEGGKGECVGIQPPPLRQDGENQDVYPLRYTYTRPTIQPKKRTSRAGLVWRKKHHRPPSSPRYHHHIYEIGNTDGERATNPTKKEKQTRLGWHQ